MAIDCTFVADLVKSLAWPGVTISGFLLFRQPLIDLASEIGRRANKLSLYNVSIELATLPELSPPWCAGAADVRQLTPSQIFDSNSVTLFEQLLKPREADYAVVDLGAGREWLTSRLFVFALVLGTVARSRAFVFVETKVGVRRRFLGIATPSEIQTALVKQYPWLEEAYYRAAAAPIGQIPIDSAGISRFSNQSPLFSSTNSFRVQDFVQRFIDNLQRKTKPPQQEAGSHLELQNGGMWERAHWIDGDLLERDLDGLLSKSWYERLLDAPRRAVVESVARRDGPFVALVDGDRRFLGLVDRYALLDQMGKQIDP